MKKYTYEKDYRDFLNEVANSILKYKSWKLLSDDRNNQGIAKEDKEWGKNEWFPRGKAFGWRYWAVVLPENAIGKLTMKNVVNDVTSKVSPLSCSPIRTRRWHGWKSKSNTLYDFKKSSAGKKLNGLHVKLDRQH